MNTETYANEVMIWNDDVVAENDILIAAIEEDIAQMKAELHRLSDNDEQDDILFM